MNNIIGSRIRKVRENKGISQEAMALELGITQSNYGRLEKSDNRLTVPKIEKIAKVLGITVSYLFNEKTQKISHQNHNENESRYTADTLNTIINANKEHITSLKEEIAYLMELLKK